MNPIRVSMQVQDITIAGYPTLTGVTAFDIPNIQDIEAGRVNGRGNHRALSGALTVDHVYSKRKWVIGCPSMSVDAFTAIMQAHDLQLSNNSVVQIDVLDGCGSDYLTVGMVDVFLEIDDYALDQSSMNGSYYDSVTLKFTEM